MNCDRSGILEWSEPGNTDDYTYKRREYKIWYKSPFFEHLCLTLILAARAGKTLQPCKDSQQKWS